MAKATKKKNLKLRRRIRKTIGTMLLISSLIVAAIPVESFEGGRVLADDSSLGSATIFPGSYRNFVTKEESKVPIIDTDETVYTSGDGMFQYAYVYKRGQNTGDKVAVIVGYNSTMLENNALVIPDTLDIYKKFTHSYGSGAGYIAVGKSGNDLWYKVDEHKKVSSEYVPADGEVVVDGYLYNKILLFDPQTSQAIIDTTTGQQAYELEKVLWARVYPCYYNDLNVWSGIDSNQLYTPVEQYKDYSMADINDPQYYKLTTTEEERRVENITVAYIGNQSLKTDVVDGKEVWSIGDWITPEAVKAGTASGVFANMGNIVTLEIGPKLEGIGDFAFYGCSGLNSITIGNGINTMGNYAFANCTNLRAVNIPQYCNLTALGSHAFYNTALNTFAMPVNVEEIGDYCFSKCTKMTDITLNYDLGGLEDARVKLNNIGDYCFAECSSLKELVFPESMDVAEHGTSVDVSMFKGCTSLEHITFLSDSMDVIATKESGYNYAAFKNNMIPEFYFEGIDALKLHGTCNDNEIAYKYLDKDLYEIVIKDESGNKSTYRVNSNNELHETLLDPGVKDVVMPDTVGPYQITNIASNSFQNSCNIETITIPASIRTISEYAFRGCHNLKHVMFKDALSIQAIGTDAFQTQKIDTGVCGHSADLSKDPILTFTGAISYDSVPFMYAMNPASRINQGSQNISYITYYSGWPSNLTVKYLETEDENGNVVGMSTLVDYPTFTALAAGEFNDRPYMTDDYIAAITGAKDKFSSDATLLQDEKELVDACLHVVIPEGVKGIKENLFIDKEVNADAVNYPGRLKVVTTNSIIDISEGMFKGWKNLKEANILGEAQSIGKYAFEDCEALEKAKISANVSSMDLRPFKGCEKLYDIDFMGSSYFSCENGIIFGLSNGSKNTIVECLESRGLNGGTSYIQASELAGVSYIQNEAFMDVLGVAEVDLKSSAIKKIPSLAFALTDNTIDSNVSEDELKDAKATCKLSRVLLPAGCTTIEEDAFKNSPVSYLELPSSVAVIHPDAFDTKINENKNGRVGCVDPLTFYCVEDSVAAIYADGYDNIERVDREPDAEELIVVLQYLNPLTQEYITIDTQTILSGGSATKPALEDLPKIDGYSFVKWIPSDDFSNITTGTTFTAIYSNTQYTVNFYECDEHENSLIGTITVPEGYNVTELDYPEYTPKEGYNIIGWTGLVNPVSENLNVYAKCVLDEYVVRFWDADGTTLLFSQTGASGDTLYEPKSPTKSGMTFAGWIPAVTTTITGNADYYATYTDGNGNLVGSGGADSNGGVISDGKYYTLTVKNGSGSGSYVAGSEVIITANAPASGQAFKNWTADTTDAKIIGDTNTAAVIVMPAKSVTVTANYKSASGTNAGVGGGSSNNAGSNNSGSNGVVGNVSSGGTTVVIDKNGFSNQGVVSVKVNGASDNFVIKISESATATEAVVKALMDKYGTLDNIVYFPMDISLYDSTGTKKITDTTGLSISITLPIPDSLIKYAGNNKVAAVANGKLESLTPKFTTIDKVSCVTFTAEHFSPYVIYVDKENLTAGTVTDNSPQTGDGIHPKWFLSIGLLCIAMVLFMKKDRVAGASKVLA